MSGAARAAGSVRLVALLAVLNLPAAAGGPPYKSGWHSRPDGTWPWTSRRGQGSYHCLRWNHGGESYDTLHGPEYFVRDCDSCFLKVRTFYEPGRAYPGPGDLPTIELLVSDDGGHWWKEVRYYGLSRCDSLERIDVSSWAIGSRTLHFAWASHVYDSANVRWWCIDDVRLNVFPRPESTLAIIRVLQPRTDFVYATGDAVTPVFMLSSFGRMVSGEVAMEVWIAGRAGRQDMQVLQQHYMLDDPWDYGGRWSLPSGDYELRARLGRYVPTDTVDCGYVFAPSGEDSVSVEVRFAENVWQMQNEYPGPDRLIAPGTAVAADRRKRLFVRNCGARDTRDSSNAGLFLVWSLATANWSTVRSYADFTGGSPSYEGGGAVVAQDSLLYCTGSPGGALLRWNIKRDRWSQAKPMPAPLLRPDLTPGAAGSTSLAVLGRQGWSLRGLPAGPAPVQHIGRQLDSGRRKETGRCEPAS